MNFEEALKLLKAGKKIRRKDWKEDHDKRCFIFGDELCCESEDGVIGYIGLSIKNILATDWEEYKKPLLTEREKRYLEEIINFSPAEAADISEFKIEDHLSSNRKLIAFYNKDNRVIMEILIKEDCLKGLEKNTSYTLKELELDEPL